MDVYLFPNHMQTVVGLRQYLAPCSQLLGTPLILPQLFKSIANFAGQYDTYMNSATVQLNKAIAWINALVSGITHRDILHPIADGALQKSIADFLGGQDLLAIL